MAIRQALKKALLLVPAMLLAQGCTTLPVDKEAQAKKPAKHVRKIHKAGRMPCQLVSTWKNEVVHVADPVHGGAPIPGLAGRFYLFGEEVDTPIEAEGNLTVDLYDLTKGPGGQPVLLENWQLDPVTLKKLKRKDPVGEGYTLFLPWGTYRPDITRVQLKLKYDAGGEFPLFGDTGPLTLNSEINIQQSRHTMAPGAGGQLQTVNPGAAGTPPALGVAPGQATNPATLPGQNGTVAPLNSLPSGQPVSRVVVPTGPLAAGASATGLIPVSASGVTPPAGGRSTRLTIEPVDYNPPKAEGFGPARIDTIGPRNAGGNHASGVAAPAPEVPAGPKVWSLR